MRCPDSDVNRIASFLLSCDASLGFENARSSQTVFALEKYPALASWVILRECSHVSELLLSEVPW